MQSSQIPNFDSNDSLAEWLVSIIEDTQSKTPASIIQLRVLRQDGSPYLHITFPGNRLTGDPSAPSPGSVRVTEQVLENFRNKYFWCVAENYTDDNPEYIVYDIYCFLAHAKKGIISLETENDLRTIVLRNIGEISDADYPDLEYFILHAYPDGGGSSTKRVVITFHERIYSVGVGRDIPHDAIVKRRIYTVTKVDALLKFRTNWVEAESTENSRKSPLRLTYLISAFTHLTQVRRSK